MVSINLDIRQDFIDVVTSFCFIIQLAAAPGLKEVNKSI